jgi:hypothetical protein
MQQRIAGFHQDEKNDWAADLECGHTQYVRHNPPWEMRPWVVEESSRNKFLGKTLECKKCDESYGNSETNTVSPLRIRAERERSGRNDKLLYAQPLDFAPRSR